MRIAIITYCRREDGHPGGVPKHAWYLKRALTEAGHEVHYYAWHDYPAWRKHDGEPEHFKARRLSSYLASQDGMLRDYDRIIADGFWACGLPDDAPVTVVCHGTWAGLATACGGVDADLIAAQGEAYRRFPVVAVSRAAAKQTERYHGARVAAIIPNGVDLGMFRPVERAPNDRPVVLYAGRGYSKGEDIVHEVARLLDGQAGVEYLDASLGMEARAMQRGDVFLHPSRHEGDSYAIKEAAACGLPVVASRVGGLEDEPGAMIGEVVDGFDPADYRAAVERVLADRQAYQPRRWAQEHADFEEFARAWREYLRADGQVRDDVVVGTLR